MRSRIAFVLVLLFVVAVVAIVLVEPLTLSPEFKGARNQKTTPPAAPQAVQPAPPADLPQAMRDAVAQTPQNAQLTSQQETFLDALSGGGR